MEGMGIVYVKDQGQIGAILLAEIKELACRILLIGNNVKILIGCIDG